MRNKLEAGPCRKCGLYPHLLHASVCQKCKTEWIRDRRKTRLAEGLCIECGLSPHLPGIHRCQDCKERIQGNDAARRQRCIEQNICVTRGCGKPIKSNIRCESCLDKQNKFVRTRRHRLSDEGLCSDCGRAQPTGNHLCKVCYFKKLAKKNLGTRSKWVLLEEKLESQKYTCPYTGIHLVIGGNASLDHIVPKSLDGRKDIDNLQWVHKWINLMKYDLSHEEFVAKFAEFINHCKGITNG